MKRRLKLVLSGNDDVKMYEDNSISKLSKSLDKLGLGENVVLRYVSIMAYSNQIEYMAVNFLASVLLFLYHNNEEENDVTYFAASHLGKKTNYKDDEYKRILLEYIAQSQRYVDHFFICSEKANLGSLQSAKEKDYKNEEVSNGIFNEFDFYD